jgi:hypothetical protein
LLHEGADWHKPFEECFEVPRDDISSVMDALCERWDAGNPMTFYELESHFKMSHRHSGLDRGRLVDICRYIFLHACPDDLDGKSCHRFDKEMWHTLVKNHECPAEAHYIVRPAREAQYGFM